MFKIFVEVYSRIYCREFSFKATRWLSPNYISAWALFNATHINFMHSYIKNHTC